MDAQILLKNTNKTDWSPNAVPVSYPGNATKVSRDGVQDGSVVFEPRQPRNHAKGIAPVQFGRGSPALQEAQEIALAALRVENEHIIIPESAKRVSFQGTTQQDECPIDAFTGRLMAASESPGVRKVSQDATRLTARTMRELSDESQPIGEEVVTTFLKLVCELSDGEIGLLDLNSFANLQGDGNFTQDVTARKHAHLQREAEKLTRGYATCKTIFIPLFFANHTTLGIYRRLKRLRKCEFWDPSGDGRDQGSRRLGQSRSEQFQTEVSRFFANYASHDTVPEFVNALEDRVDHQVEGEDGGAFVCFYALLRGFGRLACQKVADDARMSANHMRLFRLVLRGWLEPLCSTHGEGAAASPDMDLFDGAVPDMTTGLPADASIRDLSRDLPIGPSASAHILEAGIPRSLLKKRRGSESSARGGADLQSKTIFPPPLGKL